jgi:hypothetical protein
MTRQRRMAKFTAGGSLVCLVLTACNRNQPQQPVTGAPIAALQLATTPPPPMQYAPPASALPPPPAPARIAYRPPRERYRYLTDAYDMADAFGDTPPDYAIDYDGERPWIWRADDGAYRLVEWVPDGARSYYYEPGAEAPFLIEDPDYAYAYDDGALVAVYTRAGALVADSLARQRAYDAARYYAHAQDLYRAAQRERREAAYAANWQQRAPIIFAQRERWVRARETQPEWRDWSRAHQSEEAQRWAPERQHRLAYASALARAAAPGALRPNPTLPTPIRSSEPQRISARPHVMSPAVRPGKQPQQPASHPLPIDDHSRRDQPPAHRGPASVPGERTGHDRPGALEREARSTRPAAPPQTSLFRHAPPQARHAAPAPGRQKAVDAIREAAPPRIMHADHARSDLAAAAAREHRQAVLRRDWSPPPAASAHPQGDGAGHVRAAPTVPRPSAPPHVEAHAATAAHPPSAHGEPPHIAAAAHAGAAEGHGHDKRGEHRPEIRHGGAKR